MQHSTNVETAAKYQYWEMLTLQEKHDLKVRIVSEIDRMKNIFGL